jgi:hypothetical protein
MIDQTLFENGNELKLMREIDEREMNLIERKNL